MINRFMRLIVMFDLPVVTERDKKIYSKFRRFLLDDGYFMLQYSIYVRVCKNADDVRKHEIKLSVNMPSKGNVRLLQVTENQFQNMKILCGKSTNEEKIGIDSLIVFE